MLFNTTEFFLFLSIVLVLYYSLNHRFQNYLLLIASYIFYGLWDYRFLSLILISTTVDYFAGQGIRKSLSPGRKKLFLFTSLTVNLGILGFFKYFNFFVDSAERLLSAFGFQSNLPVLYIILPVGISFYTFQTMAYTIEVYKGNIKPVDNFFDFALYVCYFPQLVAGPIERPQNLIPAIQSPRIVDTKKFTSGLVLILIGLFRKVVIADGLSNQIEPIFTSPQSFSTPELMKGVYLFALQIYCDFAGYSDIARGVSRLLGIELMRNFEQPYFSSNISEFWRRWHVSLSTWLRDYLYIPLGGNRKGTINTYRNMMITMLLGGLWHGAAWTFVIWGGLHGLYLSGYRIFTSLAERNQPKAPLRQRFNWQKLIGILVTFHLVLFAWIFFRAPNLSPAIEYIRNIFALQGLNTLPQVLPGIIIPWILVILIDIPQYITGEHTVLLKWPRLARNLAVAVMAALIIIGFGTRAPFIYFQF
jgi:D-alanyl-lipoteichoic acid acyltransferase DltB (MBOAT superfamily)